MTLISRCMSFVDTSGLMVKTCPSAIHVTNIEITNVYWNGVLTLQKNINGFNILNYM